MQRKKLTNQQFVAAARNGKTAVVKAFIEENDKEALNNECSYSQFAGKTALGAAAQYGRLEVVELLVQAGARVDLACNDKSEIEKGHSPLYYALKGPETKPKQEASLQDRLKTIQVLLSAKADLISHQQKLFCAALIHTPEAFDLLRKAGANFDPKHPLYQEALEKVISCSDTNKINFMISLGIPLDTSIACALQQDNNADMVTFLLKAGAKACSTDQRLVLSLIKLAAKRVVKMETFNENDKTSICLILQAAPGIANTLVPFQYTWEYPKRLTKLAGVQYTLLMLAAALDLLPTVVEILLADQHTNVSTTNPDGETALSLAAQFNSFELFEQLLKTKPTLDNLHDQISLVFEHLVLNDNLTSLKLFVQAGADPWLKNKVQRTPLHFAALENKINITMYLLSLRPSQEQLNPQDNRGCTPLMLAAYKNNTDTVIALLDAGAELHHKTNHGVTVTGLTKNPVIRSLLDKQTLPQQLQQFERFRQKRIAEHLPTLERAANHALKIRSLLAAKEETPAERKTIDPEIQLAKQELPAEDVVMTHQEKLQEITNITLDSIINGFATLQSLGSHAGEYQQFPALLRQFYEFLIALNDPRLEGLQQASREAAAKCGDPLIQHIQAHYFPPAPDRDKSPPRAPTLFTSSPKKPDDDKEARRNERRF